MRKMREKTVLRECLMIMLSDCMITKQHMEISSIKAAAPGLG